MKHIVKYRWALIAVWIIAAIVLTVFSPNLQQLVAEKGQISVPDEYRSKQAAQLLQEMSDSEIRTSDIVLVFHEENGLTENNKKDIKTIIDRLDEAKEALEITSIIDFTEDERIEESTLSEDETTLLVPIEATTVNQSIVELRDKITEIADEIDVQHALTGEVLIAEDIVINSQEGLKKTIYITVALILVILLVVFRSLVAPIIPLLTVGISYLVAEGIVAYLAEYVNFPLSTFTQVFMVAIMFGIGTDYTILVISRFKEELTRRETTVDAVIHTYKASGKTVFYAALAVLIGFSTIGLSQFTLYQSAISVAVGVFVVTLAIFSIIPFFLVLLGKKLFWPFDKNVEHKESKLWGRLGHFTWTRPVISILIVLAIVVPALFVYKGEQTYDNLAELSDRYDTVKAFNWIEESFGPGEIMPVTVVMELNEKIEDANDFQSIETITAEIADLEEIEKVRSATRPIGDIIEDFLLESQTDTLSEGFEEMMDGVNELQDGLQQASSEMKEQAPQLQEAEDGVQQLMDGTKQINDGIGEIQHYLREIEKGIMDGSLGAGEIEQGLRTIKGHLDETIAGHKQILAGYEQIEQGLRQAEQMIENIDIDIDSNKMEEMMQGIRILDDSIDNMYMIAVNNDPSLAADENSHFNQSYGGAKHIIGQMKAGIEEAKNQLASLENIDMTFMDQVIDPLEQLNNGYRQTIQGQEQLVAGLQDLIEGVAQLKSGLQEASSGQGEIANNVSPIRDGLSEIYGGQDELKGAFTELQDGLTELSDGLQEGADGLGEIHGGLEEVNRYLSEMDLSSQGDVVVIPDEALEVEEFWEAAELYLSPDHTIVTFEAVLNIHPYSKEALMLVDEIEETVDHAIEKTNLDVNKFFIGGISSINNDLHNVSAEDYKRTATLMLIGIFLILVFLLRSLVMPIYLIASLLLTYYTSIGITEFIFINLFDYEGLTWAIPFFSFVMLIALGVDYSIFLMSRFNEYKDSLLYDGMMTTMKNMGTVIISATVILGGTFAAMLPAGVLSLLQIATVVIIGLALYALVVLPLLTPIFVKLFGKYNWWPFTK